MNVDGIKIGYMSGVGYNFVSFVIEGNMCLVVVVMGIDNENVCKVESKKLLSYGFCFFEIVVLYKVGEIFVNEIIWMGDKDMIVFGVDKDIYVILLCG